ncbi:MAG: GNAT family N-acetyltransferase [Candidatus Peregrinibacteria bacterium]|nr:GNAT family N-acetyltransferase [Candidatus Peregrinibacteria bacterium]
MKFHPLRRKSQKKAAKTLKYFFPILGLIAAWKLYSKIKIDRSKVFEARKKKKFLGVAVFSIFAFFGQKFLRLKLLAVAPQNHKKGIGSKMIEKIEKYAKKRKRNYIFFTSHPSRKNAHNFYQHRGFKKILGFLFYKKLK